MGTAADDCNVLASAKIWSATPGNYSSLRCLQFDSDGEGQAIYGYGQTIYIVIPFRWGLPDAGRLRLTYSAPTVGVLVKEFVLHDGNRVKELTFTLTPGRVAGTEDTTGLVYECDHTLELSASPWPDGLVFPWPTPQTFFGRAAK